MVLMTLISGTCGEDECIAEEAKGKHLTYK
jgi:hypothetical protein